MTDKQISQFNLSAPVNGDIVHGKKASGEDVRFSIDGITSKILAEVPAQPSILSRPIKGTQDLTPFMELQRTDGVYERLSLSSYKALLADIFYPVGWVATTTTNTNPGTYWGGVWVAFGQGRVLVGAGSGTDVNGVSQSFSAGATGGEYTHTLLTSEMPSHTHNITVGDIFETSTPRTIVDASNSVETGTTSALSTSSIGGSAAHNNVQPYITVYMWHRIS